MPFECHNISFKYPSAPYHVFHNLSFEIAEPGFDALFGPSGIGKTSFAKMIVGEITAFSGEIKTDGMDRILYSYNLERLPGWSTVGKHLDKITPDAQKDLQRELVEALTCLHSLGVAHRDIKLENIMFDDKNLKLVDFGFACDKVSFNVMCKVNMLGTPYYISPEIWLGVSNKGTNEERFQKYIAGSGRIGFRFFEFS